MDAVRRFPGVEPAVFALHGFTQHGGMFEELAAGLPWEIVAPDLPGHGSASDTPADFDSAVQAISRLVGHRPLLGYSQGGRIALGVALRYPQAASHLILVSAGLGIGDPQRRRDRLETDAALADRIERDGLASFVDSWLDLPMFDGLRRRGSEWCAHDKELRLENTAKGVAAALRGMGQGSQPYFGDRLGELQMPVLAIAGALDPAYVEIGECIAVTVSQGVAVTVEGVGHPVIGEAPDRIAGEIRRFLTGSGDGRE
jgi:2-succinyl-6-hydroxy-2,4-cyclohexadiene-1-carboxylate synthase